MRTREKSPLETAAARVTAGLMLAPGLPKACATITPQSTASAHPVVITIQPESAAYDLRSVTPAFTPLPSSTSTSVPMNSPHHTECMNVPSNCAPPTALFLLLGNRTQQRKMNFENDTFSPAGVRLAKRQTRSSKPEAQTRPGRRCKHKPVRM